MSPSRFAATSTERPRNAVVILLDSLNRHPHLIWAGIVLPGGTIQKPAR